MKKLFSKLLDILKHPRGWSLFVFYILFACTLTAAIAFTILAPTQTILCYVCYALAAAGLAYFVYTIVYLAPKIKNSTVRAMHRHRFTDNLLNNYGFRTVVFATVGFVVNIGYALLQTIVCLPAAYAFAKLRFPGKNIVFMAFMGSMMLPGQLTIITNNITMVDLKLVNNLMSVILLSIFSAFAIFMMKQYFMNLPKDLDDAAKIDGCSIWGAFLFVDVPLAMPIVSVNLILCFNSAWGGFFLPMIFLRKMEVMTVPLGMTVLQGAYNTESKAVLVAALMLSIVPVVIIFFLFRKQLIAGIATSGLKV